MAEYVVGYTDDLDPTHVRERVVRCRDCARAHRHDGGLDCSHFSQWDYYSDDPGHWMVEPDGFCAWAKPRRDA